MFKFFERRAAQRNEAAKTTAERYRALLDKLATDGDLKGKDEGDMVDVMAELGITDDQATTQAQALREHRELSAIASRGPEAAGAAADIDRKLATHDTETARQLSALTQERSKARDAISSQRVAPGATIKAANKARARMNEIEEAHWALFGRKSLEQREVDRANAAKVAFLVHHELERPEPAGARSILFELLLRNPNAHGDLSRFSFVQAPGQDPAEFAEMLAIVQNTPEDRLARVAYLRHDLHGHPNYRRINDSSMVQIFDKAIEAPNFDVDAFHFIRYPGQSQAELGDLIRQLKEAKAKREKQMAGVR